VNDTLVKMKAVGVDRAIAQIRVDIAKNRAYEAHTVFALNVALSGLRELMTEPVKASFFDYLMEQTPL
jgi:hypothetical protein